MLAEQVVAQFVAFRETIDEVRADRDRWKRRASVLMWIVRCLLVVLGFVVGATVYLVK